MNVLHLCSDFARQEIYAHLISWLEAKSISRQHVYIPVRTETELNGNRDSKLQRTTYRYSYILQPRHRLLYRSKIKLITRDVLQNDDVDTFDVIHAHFLFSDGGVAYALHKRYAIPYIVALRNTDLNFFLKYRPDLRATAWKIVESASSIIFLSPSYQNAFLKKVPNPLRNLVEEKSKIVPNGIADLWHEWPEASRPKIDPIVRLLYVGDFSRNKNVKRVVRAAEMLRKFTDISLTLVGGGGNADARIKAMLHTGRYPFIQYLGRENDKQKLREIYRQNDIFVMPSFRETFGVAYIEALSQGLPIVHSYGQGIDGYFSANTVSEATDPSSVSAIAASIQRLSNRRDLVRLTCIAEAKRFEWKTIAGEYLDIYDEAAAERLSSRRVSARR